ncbi:MAG: DUF3047 domain-containing protein [Ectothiorhodospiraceae bacterium]|nr:DUF3047 domain-containing protein [Chromatiales bacterium]MCP5154374.1 DUF3047 domain-containing protein [Ectothiorhodospiraceae bacterium]
MNTPLRIPPLIAVAVAWLGLVAPLARADLPRVAVLEAGAVAGWEERQFDGRTEYVSTRLGNLPVVRATSSGGASGLYRQLEVDLTRTPLMRWSWGVERGIDNRGERSRAGDDFAARVYVVAADSMMFWRSRAVCYVWTSHVAPGTTWPSPYTDHVMMVAVRSGTARPGELVAEQRDVRADFERFFGPEVTSIDSVAIMTDTDGTGQRATAYYGDLWFTARE